MTGIRYRQDGSDLSQFPEPVHIALPGHQGPVSRTDDDEVFDTDEGHRLIGPLAENEIPR